MEKNTSNQTNAGQSAGLAVAAGSALNDRPLPERLEKPDGSTVRVFSGRRPLPQGTEIEYCGLRATVVEDHGSSLVVDTEGARMTWYWRFCGTECTVVSLPNVKDQPHVCLARAVRQHGT